MKKNSRADAINVPRLVTKIQLLELLNIKATTLWKWMSVGSFPLPIEIGPGGGRNAMSAWLESEVVAWVASRPRRQIGRRQFPYQGPRDEDGKPTPVPRSGKRERAKAVSTEHAAQK